MKTKHLIILLAASFLFVGASVTAFAKDKAKVTDASDSKITYIGRVIKEGPDVSFDWSGVQCRLRFNGTGISLKDDPFKPETENCNLTYAAIASRYFDADCILVCHSGRGIARNYNDWGKGIARTTMPEKYEYVFDEAEGPLCEKPEQTPDLVVVYLGASMHPNHVGQKKMAFNIIPYISTITGWEMK